MLNPKLKLNPKIFNSDVEQIPIHIINNVPSEVDQRTNIIRFTEEILALKTTLSKTALDSEVTRLEKRCNSLERQIDEAVYSLYGLTEEEIKIVEGGK